MRAHITVLGLFVVYINLTSAFLLPIAGIRSQTQTHPAHDMLVTLPAGEVRTVAVEEGQSILDALEADDIDAPHSCRSGLCTECAAIVTANLDSVKLEAAVLDPEISAMGFVLTCSATVEGGGVELELGAGDKMYEAQYGDFRKGHDDAQNSKPGKWNLPFPDVSGA
eukprot:jgi/Undpi1/3103/HiC_scaffold_15.g06477.m1